MTTLAECAKARDLSLASLAVAWVLRQEGITCAIIGASRVDQLAASIDATNVTIDAELAKACDAMWWNLPRRPVIEGYR